MTAWLQLRRTWVVVLVILGDEGQQALHLTREVAQTNPCRPGRRAGGLLSQPKLSRSRSQMSVPRLQPAVGMPSGSHLCSGLQSRPASTTMTHYSLAASCPTSPSHLLSPLTSIIPKVVSMLRPAKREQMGRITLTQRSYSCRDVHGQEKHVAPSALPPASCSSSHATRSPPACSLAATFTPCPSCEQLLCCPGTVLAPTSACHAPPQSMSSERWVNFAPT